MRNGISKGKQLSLIDLIYPKLTWGGCSGCICDTCMRWWQGRCPYGGCYDDHRAEAMPYDKAHPGVVRKLWTDWDKHGEQAHWCRGGSFYLTEMCEHYVEHQKPVVKECLCAVVQIWPDGCIDCSLVDAVGCEACMRSWEARQRAKEDDSVDPRSV